MQKLTPARNSAGFKARWLLWGVAAVTAAHALPSEPSQQRVAAALARQRTAFVENQGQADPGTKFLFGSQERSFALQDAGVILPSGGVELRFEDSNTGKRPRGEHPLAHRAGRTTTPVRFGQVRYPHLYPGTDVIFHGGGRDHLEFDAVVAPGADPSAIVFSFTGADRVSLTGSGDVDIAIGNRHAWVRRPVSYQERIADTGTGRRQSVDGGFVMRPDGRIGFSIGHYDRSRTLIIDPVIEVGPLIGTTQAKIAAASYLGGSDVESIDDIQTDGQRQVYVMGRTTTSNVFNSDFPQLQSPIAGDAPSQSSGSFCFLAKFDPTLSQLESAVILLGYSDGCEAMALAPNLQNPAGSSLLTIVAHAPSTQLQGTPLVKYVQQFSTDGGFTQVGIATLDALDAATPVHGLKVDSNGNTYVLGDCETTLRADQGDFPPLPAGYRTTSTACTPPGDGRGESMLFKLDPQLAPIYATFIGGTPAVTGSIPARDTAWSLAIDDAGIAYVGGQTVSGDLPLTANAFSSSYTAPVQCAAGQACGEGFLAAFDSTVTDLSSLAYATLFPTYSKIVALAAGADGIEFASHGGGPVGCCASSFSNSSGGVNALIVGKLDRTLVGVQQMRFEVLADDANDQLLALDDRLQIIRYAHGESALVGLTHSASAATLASTSTGIVQPLYAHALDACAGCAVPFLWTLTADGTAVDFTTFLDDVGHAKPARIAGDAGGNIYLATSTSELNRATAGSSQGTVVGQDDALILKINGAVRAEQPVASIDAAPGAVAYSSAGASVTLTAASTYDPDPASPLTYSWGGAFLGNSGTSVTQNLAAGSYTVPLTVTDAFGNTSTTSSVVKVDAGAGVGTQVAVTPLNTDSYAAFLDLTPVSLLFSTVTAQGPVTLTTRTDQTPPIPTGQELGSSPFYYDVATTANFSGPVTICIDLTGVSFADPAATRLYRLNGTAWQDITGNYDLANHKICGSTTQLGTFAVFDPAIAATQVTTVVGTGYRWGAIDGPGGDPRDDLRDNVDATLTELNETTSAVFDAARGWLYIADSGDNRVRRVNLQTNVIDTIAGTGQVSAPMDGIDARSSDIGPSGVAVDKGGNLFIADGYCRIRRVDYVTNIITTVAGAAGPNADNLCFYSGDNHAATLTNIQFPGRLAFDPAGNLFFTQDSTVRRINAGADGFVTGAPEEFIVTVAGNGVEGLPTTGSVPPGASVPPTSVSIQPRSLAFNSQGDLYVGMVALVSRVTAGADGIIHGAADERLSNVIGCTCPLGLVPFGGDGSTASLADAGDVVGIAVDANGDMLLMDVFDNRVRKVTAGASGLVTGAADEHISTVAGFTYSPDSTDARGFNGDGYAPSTSFLQPFDVLVDPRGGYLVLDSFNGRIRHFGTPGVSGAAISVTVAPTTVTVAASGQVQFTPTVTNTANPAVTWSVDEAGGGSVSAAGVYTAPNAQGIFHVRATSVADTTKFGEATITVSAPLQISVTVAPTTVTVAASGQVQFTPTVTNTANPAVTWSVDEAGGGSVSAAGVYTAPNAQGIFHVRATSVADTTKFGEATITVSAPLQISVTVAPTTVTVAASGQVQFTPTVTNTANPAVTWSVDEAGGGSVSAAGVYTAPNAQGIFHVRATSVADTTKFGEATITVSAPLQISVTVAPTTVTVAASGQVQFTPTVTNTANPAVTWSVDEAGGGSVSAAGVYTAPNAQGIFHVRATSVADTTKFGEATITVSAPPAFSPSSLTFAAQGLGTTSAAQTITVSNPGVKKLPITGLYTGGLSSGSPFRATSNCAAIPAAGSCPIKVTFTPIAAGLVNSSVSVVTPLGTLSAPLSGTGIDTTPTFSPSGLTFAPQDVGTTSVAQTITMTNPGAVALHVQQAAVGIVGEGAGPADFNATSNCRPSIPAGTSCTITVTFKPLAAGARDAVLTIVDDAGTQKLPLNGTGVDGTPTFSPSSLTFAPQDVGTTSAAQAITVTNPGLKNLRISGFYTGFLSGGSADFAAKNNCAGVIAAGGSCVISVTFKPTIAGAINSSVSIVDPLGTQSVPLSGSGVDGTPTFSPSVLTFPAQDVGTISAVQTITVANPGLSRLPVSQIYIGTAGGGSGGGARDFLETDNCRPGIAAGGSCVISVKFAPSTAGARTAPLSIVDALGTQTPVSLGGTGVNMPVTFSPSSLTFAPQDIGTASVAQTITVTNPGVNALPVTGFYTGSESGGSGDFAVTSNCRPSIAAGATCTIIVTFKPTVAGLISSSVSIVDALGTQTVPLSGTGVNGTPTFSPGSLTFPAQDVSTISAAQTITVTNPGVKNLRISGFYTGGSSAGGGNFAATNNCGGVIAAGGSCVISVTFRPTVAGALSSSVSIVTPLGTQSVPLSGTAVDGTPTFSPNSLTFTAQDVGTTSVAQTITVTNPGLKNLPITGLYTGGLSAGSQNFAATSNCRPSIAAGGSCVISVTFKPTAIGATSSSVSIVDPLGTQSVSLSGTGLDATPTFSPSGLTFAAQDLGTTSPAQSITMTNTGVNPLHVAQVVVGTVGSGGGGAFADFTATSNCRPGIAVGGNCTIRVTFTPTAATARNVPLTIVDDAGTQTLALSGTGVDGTPIFSPSGLTFAAQAVGTTSAAQTITVSNPGVSRLRVTQIYIGSLAGGSRDFAETDNCRPGIAAGGSCVISVKFTPSAAGALSAPLSIVDGLGTQSAVSLSGTGQ